MAERRMFTKKVTDDDNFMALSSSAQALYLHLSMAADDDGFCNQVTSSMFKAHASVDDLKALLEKRYIYQFENGVIVIKHWRMANALRKDRYTPTAFQEELRQLRIKENGSYSFTESLENTDDNALVANLATSGCRLVATGKDSIGKYSLKESIEQTASHCDANVTNDVETKVSTPKHKYGQYNNVLLTDEELSKLKAEFPDWEQRIERLSEYIASKGAKYKSHLATIRSWARKDKAAAPSKKNNFNNFPQRDTNLSELEELLLNKQTT